MKQSTISKQHAQSDNFIVIALGIFALFITTGLHVVGIAPTFIRCALSLIAATTCAVWTYLHYTETSINRVTVIGPACAFLAILMDITYLMGLVFISLN